MKKALILILIFLFCGYVLYSTDYIGNTYSTESRSISFEKDHLIHKYWDSDKQEQVVENRSCSYQEISKIPFIIFDDDVYSNWLILHTNGIVLIYNEDNDKPFFRGFLRPAFEMSLLYIEEDIFQTTSFLEEGKTVYLADNLRIIDTNKPWSEGVAGNGIGEKIIMKEFTRRRFFISNGYVSYLRPDLYEKNSRLKRIVVRDFASKEEYFFDLNDTPNLQDIILPESAGGIEIEILEVFPGTKYEDTCVNFIFGN